jgi:hypothetical protein
VGGGFLTPTSAIPGLTQGILPQGFSFGVFTEAIDIAGIKFNNLTAHGIGMFPVLSRMVLRGDIQEGDVVANRRLSLDQAIQQTYDFTHKTVQVGDLKGFTGTPGLHAMAVGRVLIEFTKEDSASEIRNIEAQKSGDTWTSTTGQLRWTAPGGYQTGHITVDSAGTQGVLGFAPNEPQKLGQMTITPKDRYSVVMATAKEPDRDLSNCDEALLLAADRQGIEDPPPRPPEGVGRQERQAQARVDEIAGRHVDDGKVGDLRLEGGPNVPRGRRLQCSDR